MQMKDTQALIWNGINSIWTAIECMKCIQTVHEMHPNSHMKYDGRNAAKICMKWNERIILNLTENSYETYAQWKIAPSQPQRSTYHSWPFEKFKIAFQCSYTLKRFNNSNKVNVDKLGNRKLPHTPSTLLAFTASQQIRISPPFVRTVSADYVVVSISVHLKWPLGP